MSGDPSSSSALRCSSLTVAVTHVLTIVRCSWSDVDAASVHDSHGQPDGDRGPVGHVRGGDQRRADADAQLAERRPSDLRRRRPLPDPDGRQPVDAVHSVGESRRRGVVPVYRRVGVRHRNQPSQAAGHSRSVHDSYHFHCTLFIDDLHHVSCCCWCSC